MNYKIDSNSDTIVACSTGNVDGAIAIVRLSGPKALEISRNVAPTSKVRDSHRFYRAAIFERAEHILDDAMVVEMHAPRSYTGEDMVELHLHASRYIVETLVERLVSLGARLAKPGEFTLRAFLSGKLDLMQAEAVSDLIGSQNEAEQRAATRQLKGGISEKVGAWLESLEILLGQARAALDFPEYPTGNGISDKGIGTVRRVSGELQDFIGRIRIGMQTGQRVCLAGAPNVGKSSLFNLWAGETRVIVDEEPGTTRDPVEIEMRDGALRWTLVDTAGFRHHAGRIEKVGIELSTRALAAANLVLWLMPADLEEGWPEAIDGDLWIVGTKADLWSPEKQADFESRVVKRGYQFAGWISSVEVMGHRGLRSEVVGHLSSGYGDIDVAGIVKERHFSLLVQARDALAQFEIGVKNQMSLDVLSYELEDAAKALGCILGNDVDLEVLEKIFSEFCIGK